MNQLSTIQLIIVWALPILFAVTVHEVSHGWVASKLGDNTAKTLGRLTLNPIKHIDILGTIIVPLFLLMLGGFIFGWAKPVPVTWSNLRKPRRDMALVAVAGPISNLAMAFIWAGIMKLGIVLVQNKLAFGLVFVYMGQAGILINLVLMILNLIPIPPLDGSRVVASFLSGQVLRAYNSLEGYGFFILVFLIAIGWLVYIIGPPVMFLRGMIFSIFGIS